jgi:hypothetical protein
MMRAFKRSHSQKSLPVFAPAIEQFVQRESGVLLTPAASLGLSYCHEELLNAIGRELASQPISQGATELQSRSTDTTLSHVLPTHVEQALACLGMDALWIAASESVHVDVRAQQLSGKKSRSNKRRKVWTKDQEEEQNRLLAVSKDKLCARP